jgi:hypothetical protein
MEDRPRRIRRDQQQFQAFLNSEQPKYRYSLSCKNGATTTLRVFFEKNTTARKWNPNARCSAANHWAKKFSENFEGLCPAKRKKVPTIFEFAPPKSTTNSKKHKTPQELQFSVFQKNKKVRQ